jgi:hypothetical protein
METRSTPCTEFWMREHVENQGGSGEGADLREKLRGCDLDWSGLEPFRVRLSKGKGKVVPVLN